MPAAHAVSQLLSTMLSAERHVLTDADENARKTPMSKSEIPELQEHKKSRGNGRRNLDRFDRAFKYLVDYGGVKLGYLQAKLLQAGRIVLLRRMFGAEIINELDYLKNKFNITRLEQTIAVLFPRRTGKTTIQTIIAACVLVSQPDGNVCCFNLKSRQSKAWFSQTMKWLDKFKNSEEFRFTELKRDGQEKIVIRNCTQTEVALSSYPGPADAEGSNFRGMGERIALMNIDEFFFMRPSVYPTILPLLVNGSALLLTSSQNKDPDNPIRRMINAKFADTKEDAVLRLNWLQSCAPCRAAKLDDKCTHIEQQPQHFQKRSDLRRVRALLEAFGEGNYERELGNITGRSWIDSVFEEEWINTIADERNDSKAETQREYSHVFIGYDPAGEGFSKNAIVSLVFDKDNKPLGLPFRAIIVGAESFPSRAVEDVTPVLFDHIKKLRTQPAFGNATMVLVIESNLPMIADSVRRQLEARNITKCCIMAQDAKRQRDGNPVLRTGTRTLRGHPEAIAHALSELLSLGGLRFSQSITTSHPLSMDVAPRQRIITEMRSLKRKIHPPTATSRNKRFEATYEGIDDKGGVMTTDYLMAIGFVLLNREIFMSAPSYQAYRNDLLGR